MSNVRMGDGRPDAKVMLVGEAWGDAEERSGLPFSGASGLELNRMLAEAGILRSECYATNVINARPPRNDLSAWIPERKADITGAMVQRQGKWVAPIVAEGLEMLEREIGLVQPRVILALGGTALWALTGNESIVKWRGSLLSFDHSRGLVQGRGEIAGGTAGSDVRGSEQALSTAVIPTYHPAAILRMMEWRKIAIHDMKRAAREVEKRTEEPDWGFRVGLGFDQTIKILEQLLGWVEKKPLWIDLDLETKASHISCCGLSWCKLEAICIPFMDEYEMRGYWTEEQEARILLLLYRLLTHRNCWVRGQNILYDCQYTYRRWGWVPNVKQDTMISHHVLWAGLPKSLSFQASMYCDYYCNWKPDKETWKEGG